MNQESDCNNSLQFLFFSGTVFILLILLKETFFFKYKILHWVFFTFSILNVPFHCLSPSLFQVWNQMLILLGFLCACWVILFFVFSDFLYRWLSTFSLWGAWVWISLCSSCLEITVLLVCVFSLSLKIFCQYFLEYLFCPFIFSLLVKSITNMLLCLILSQIS